MIQTSKWKFIFIFDNSQIHVLMKHGRFKVTSVNLVPLKSQLRLYSIHQNVPTLQFFIILFSVITKQYSFI